MGQTYFQCKSLQCLIAGGQRIAKGRLVQQGGQSVESALGGRRPIGFQGDQRPAVADAAASFVALAIDHFADIIVGQRVRPPGGAGFSQQTAIQQRFHRL